MRDHGPIKNILLLSIEDLNDWIEPLGGHPQAYTPNLNRLAHRSTVFDQAYAAAPACSPSRTSTLFGQAPWRTGIYHNRHTWAMAYAPGSQRSIIGQARQAGWQTIGAGKVFHPGNSGLDMADWSQYHHSPTDRFQPISRVVSEGLLGSLDDFGPIADTSEPLFDDRNLAAITSTMTPGAEQVFWAYGIYRPHLPFIVPQRFFDMIKGPIETPPGLFGRDFDPNNETELADLPSAARRMIHRKMGRMLHKTGEYKAFLHAYLASIAYADHLLGKVLDHMEQTGLMDNTMIVFWSDHGWQLGEKLVFRKFTLWERALRVPLFVFRPGGPVGQCHEPVSLLDIYPTLLNVIGGQKPHPLDGQDLRPLLHGAAGRGHSPSMWERYYRDDNRSDLAMSVRSQQYRLIHYHNGAMELYDHENDPFERINLMAGDISDLGDNVLNICAELMALLPENAREALSPDILPKDLQTHQTRENGAKQIT